MIGGLFQLGVDEAWRGIADAAIDELEEWALSAKPFSQALIGMHAAAKEGAKSS